MNLFRKSVSLLLVLILTLVFTTTAFAAAAVDGFSLKVNGEPTVFGTHTHVVSEGASLLPLRALFGALGGSVDFDYDESIISISAGSSETQLRLSGGVVSREDGAALQSVIYGGRTHVPASFFEELLDVTVHLDGESRALLIADNASLDRIAALMTSDVENMPAMTAEMVTDIQMTVTVDGETETINMEVQGTVNIDFANRFQHILMNTRVMGMDIVSEIFDDGEAMFIVAEGMVLSIPSSSFDMADEMMAQFSPIAGLDIERRYFAGLRLTAGDGTYTVSGEINIPEEYYNDLFASFGDIAAFLPGMDDVNMQMNIRFNAPITFTSVFDAASSLMTFMEASYDINMTMTVDGETVVAHMVYTMIMPRIEHNVQFDTVVPAEIREAAVDMSDFML